MEHNDPRPAHEIESEHLEDVTTNLDRIKGFSDGVFSIAVTLLVLTIEIPSVPRKNADELLGPELIKLIPQFIGYVIAFLLTGMNWIVHHRLVRYLARADRRFMWQNLIFLFLVSLLPFVGGLAGRYPSAKISWVIYASYVSLVSLMVCWMWARCYKKKLTHHWVGPLLYRTFMSRSLTVCIVALCAIPLALINPVISPYAFALTPLVMRLLKPKQQVHPTSISVSESHSLPESQHPESPTS